MIYDPQSWYADSEIEIGLELPPAFHKGYRSIIPEPCDDGNRQKVYDFMVALIYCTCLQGEEFEKYKFQAVTLSREIESVVIA